MYQRVMILKRQIQSATSLIFVLQASRKKTGIVQYNTIISYITLHYIIYYINHATSHQYSASCDPQDRVGPMALTTIDIHATSHHYTTKVPLALNTIVSHATSYT